MDTVVHSNNKRIARNTAFLYVRMFISMAVSLFTSRVILKTLGFEDYGLYAIVGGVVTMFDFLNSTMSGATSRFLTYELAGNNTERLNKTFSASFWVHLIIAVFVLLLCETIGIWLLNNKLVIPEGRVLAANVVFQVSILSMMISITQVPYSSIIVAHEKMDIYAYVEMIKVFLRLGILYVLVLVPMDKLILYSFLVLLVSSGTMFFYRIYCGRHFKECHIRFKIEKEIVRPMLSFSGWDLYGNIAVMARTEGVAILINMFFGPILNAAAGIATSVQGAVMNFANNVNTAVRPQIIKYYAQSEYSQMESLINNSSMINFLIMSCMVVPLCGEMDFILQLWLHEVPPYAPIFCIFSLLFILFANMSFLVNTGNHAAGKIIRPSLINGSLYLLVVPFSFFSFKLGGQAWCSYLFNLIAVICGMLSNVYTLHINVPSYSIWRFIKKALLPSIIVFFLGIIAVLVIRYLLEPSFGRLLLSTVTSIIIMLLIAWCFMLPESIKNTIIGKLRSLLCKKD